MSWLITLLVLETIFYHFITSYHLYFWKKNKHKGKYDYCVVPTWNHCDRYKNIIHVWIADHTSHCELPIHPSQSKSFYPREMTNDDAVVLYPRSSTKSPNSVLWNNSSAEIPHENNAIEDDGDGDKVRCITHCFHCVWDRAVWQVKQIRWNWDRCYQ